jgi:hypothetical protein
MGKSEENKLIEKRKKFWVGNIILAIGLVVAGLIAVMWPTLVGLSVLGIVILFVSLIGGNILSEDFDLTTGEVRRAIAIASTVVFFGMFFLESYPQELEPLIENFWKIYATIIGFYFGSRAAEVVAEKIKC